MIHQRPPKFGLDLSHTLADGLLCAILGEDSGGLISVDSSPHGNNATHLTVGSDTPEWTFDDELNRPILDGFAYSAASTGAAIQLEREIQFPIGGDCTIACWVRQPSQAGYNCVWGGSVGSTRTYGDNALATIRVAGAHTQLLANYFFVNSTWYHYAATYDGSTYTTYRNGVAFGSPLSNSAAFSLEYFGANFEQKYSWNGELADCMVWDRVLKPQELEILADKSDPMLSGLLKPPARTWWPAIVSAPAGNAMPMAMHYYKLHRTIA